MAGILKAEPAWDALPQATPVAIRLPLRKCLSKDRKGRLIEMGDARIDLEAADGDRVLVRTESEDTSGSIHDHVVLFENFSQ